LTPVRTRQIVKGKQEVPGMRMRMRMRMKLLVLLSAVIVAAACGGMGVPAAATAGGEPPVVQHVTIDSAGVDEFLTENCGFTVLYSVTGRVTLLLFGFGSEVEQGPQLIQAVSLTTTVIANGNTFTFRRAGVDAFHVTPDGAVVYSISGNVPFRFTGSLRIDIDAGVGLVVPRHDTSGDVVAACAALAG
jgi:hypothetical protein